MKNSEICVPLAALALPGEGGDVAPGVGDEVDISGTAKVTRVEGDQAYLQVATLNGQEIAAPAAGEKTLDEEEGEMRADAAKTDRDRVY